MSQGLARTVEGENGHRTLSYDLGRVCQMIEECNDKHTNTSATEYAHAGAHMLTYTLAPHFPGKETDHEEVTEDVWGWAGAQLVRPGPPSPGSHPEPWLPPQHRQAWWWHMLAFPAPQEAETRSAVPGQPQPRSKLEASLA